MSNYFGLNSIVFPRRLKGQAFEHRDETEVRLLPMEQVHFLLWMSFAYDMGLYHSCCHVHEFNK